MLWYGELPSLRKTLNVKGEDANRGDLRIRTFTLLVELNLTVVVNVDLKLIGRFLVASRPDCVGTLHHVYPTHAYHFIVNHEAQRLRQVRLIRRRPECLSMKVEPLFNMRSKLADIARKLGEYLDKFASLGRVMHD